MGISRSANTTFAALAWLSVESGLIALLPFLEEAIIRGAVYRLGEAASVGDKAGCALVELFFWRSTAITVSRYLRPYRPCSRLASALVRVNLLFTSYGSFLKNDVSGPELLG